MGVGCKLEIWGEFDGSLYSNYFSNWDTLHLLLHRFMDSANLSFINTRKHYWDAFIILFINDKEI